MANHNLQSKRIKIPARSCNLFTKLAAVENFWWRRSWNSHHSRTWKGPSQAKYEVWPNFQCKIIKE